MAKIMKWSALLSTVLTLVFGVVYGLAGQGFALTLAITFGTTAYHFVMRLLVGFFMDRFLSNGADYRRGWFRVTDGERSFYRKLKVKKWKGKMLTYDPTRFDSRLHTWDEIARAMCQAELVHEVIVVFSFVPILASVLFGAVWVFVVTSVCAAGYDVLFVIMQRYNRPRVISMLEKREENHLQRNVVP